MFVHKQVWVGSLNRTAANMVNALMPSCAAQSADRNPFFSQQEIYFLYIKSHFPQ
jgi:hypothetical protein